MRIDELGCVEMQQTGWPGNIGDSAAESGRLEHLRMLLGEYVSISNLDMFVTSLGYVRHPKVPPEWAEKDFSSDQALPLYLAWRRSGNYSRSEEMRRRLKYKTGNGDLLSPGLFAEMHAEWLRVPLLLTQLAIFKFPYRWNDERRSFERTKNSSADYINFIHVAVYAPKWLRKLISPKTLMDKVMDYYEPEPQSAMIKNLYFNVVNKYFGENI